MNANTELWDAVCKTDTSKTRSANVRGNKITAIAPQYQIRLATEQFGPYGKTWGFKSISHGYDLVPVNGVMVFKGVFFFPGGEFPISSSCSVFTDSARTKPDHDFAKKVETDALTKALSKLGFNADVFMGLFDDHKYVEMLKAEEAKSSATYLIDDIARSWIDACAADPLVADQIKDQNYKNFILSQLENRK